MALAVHRVLAEASSQGDDAHAETAVVDTSLVAETVEASSHGTAAAAGEGHGATSESHSVFGLGQ